MTEVAEQETQEIEGTEEDRIAADMGEDEVGATDDPVAEVTTDSEAAGADTDEAGAETDQAPASDVEPEPDTQPSTEAVSEEIGKKLDALQKHVAKKMGDILGEDVTMFEVCEVCSYTNTPGWRLSGPYPPDVEMAVRHAMGQHAPAEYKKDGYSRVCDLCNGLGEVSTGSLVPGQDTIICMGCRNKGWIAVGPERGGSPLVVQPGDKITTALNDGTFDVVEVLPDLDSPEVAALKEKGYIIIPPTSFNS